MIQGEVKNTIIIIIISHFINANAVSQLWLKPIPDLARFGPEIAT